MATAGTAHLSVEELQQRLEEKEKLEQIGQKIHSTLDILEILYTIITEAAKLLNCERITVFVVEFDRAGQPVEIVSKAIMEESTEIRVPVSKNSFSGYVALNGVTVRVEDVYDDNAVNRIDPDLHFDKTWDQKTGFRTKSMLVEPIKFNDRTIGVIQSINKRTGKFSDHDEELLGKFALQAGLALNNAKAHESALNNVKRRRTLNTLLIEHGVVRQDVLDKAIEETKTKKGKFLNHLIEKYEVADDEIAKCVAELNSLEYLPFNNDMVISPSLFEKINETFCRKNHVCPYKQVEQAGKPALIIVMANPKDFYTIDSIEMMTGKKVKSIHVSTEREINQMIDQALKKEQKPQDETPHNFDSLMTEIDAMQGEETKEVDMVDVEEGADEDAGPIVKLCNSIIEEAYRRNASDIHIEPYEEYVLVRYRKDGDLEKALTYPRHARKAVVSRFKIMAEMNITERRKPQDGRIKFKQCGGKYDIELRVNTVPTVGEENEDIVMRILADSKPLPLDKMGMHERVFKPFTRGIEQPYGMILVCGPTGSGKTTTLHSAVGFINKPDTKILTAENPVEITQRGLRQVQVKPEVGLDFAAALRAFLRQDPDVILVGEMRDEETAEIGIEAALTGHLLFSTLHTNNAPETITRLVDIGIDPVVLADALICVLAQRLMRRVCKNCAVPTELSQEELDILRLHKNENGIFVHNGIEIPDGKVLKSVGCSVCESKGYKGRAGVHELLVMNDDLKRMVCSKAKVADIRKVAKESAGMVELYDDGMEKALKGVTTPEEVRHVCGG